MASGKKNYFRHSNNAFEDEKIQKCIQLLGYEGYAYYFILLELLAKKCENSFQIPITIHQQSLQLVWRKRALSTKLVVTKLQLSGLLVATFRESFIDFYIPNLAKYMGKYQNKFPPNAPNKIKEKEIKEKEIKEKNILAETPGVRQCYLESFEKRYGVKPVWAAKENSLAKKLVASIGQQEAESLAKQYPFFNDPWHVKQKHPFGLLVAQLDKVRVELNDPSRMLDSGIAHQELKKAETNYTIYNAWSKHIEDKNE